MILRSFIILIFIVLIDNERDKILVIADVPVDIEAQPFAPAPSNRHGLQQGIPRIKVVMNGDPGRQIIRQIV